MVFCLSTILRKVKTINRDYYIALLDQLSAEIKKKRPHMQKKKVLFHQDNAPCHKSMKIMGKLNELSFESPTIFSKSGVQRLLTLCWPEKNAPGKEIWLQWRSDCWNGGLFWEERQIILQKRHRKVREALEWTYHDWRKLCWWMKSNFSKKLCFS